MSVRRTGRPVVVEDPPQGVLGLLETAAVGAVHNEDDAVQLRVVLLAADGRYKHHC